MNPNFADLLPSVLKPIAKAVAVFVAAWIVVGLTWLADATGVPVADLGLEPNAIQTAVASVVLALVTWAVENRTKET